MAITLHIVAAFAFAGLGFSVFGAEDLKSAAAKPDATAQARLVAQLGSPRHYDREAACEALDALGPVALDALRKATTSLDLETRRRAADLVLRIEKRLEAAELTQPKKVRLVFTDTPVPQAVQDIARKTGFSLQIDGDQSKLANRKITLDTGDVPFWQAIDQFCDKAGLMEHGSVPILENTGAAVEQVDGMQAVYVGGRRPPRTQMSLVFVDGKPQPMPTYYGGAVRVRILPRPTATGGASRNVAPLTNADAGFLLTCEISPEPKMGLRNILSVRVDRVLDDKGKDLKVPLPYIYNPDDTGDPEVQIENSIYMDRMGQRGDLSTRVPLRFRVPEGVKQFKELRGSVAAEVLTPTIPLITLENILDAAGKSVDGKYGGTLKVSDVKRDDKGQVTLKVTVENPPTFQAGGMYRRMRNARMRGGVIVADERSNTTEIGRVLSLVDEKGQAFKLAAAEEKVLGEQTRATVEFQLTFEPSDGADKPAKLQYLGRRRTTIDVPFVLKDVPVR